MDADVVDDDDEVVVNILKTIATKCKKELQRGHVLLRSKRFGQNLRAKRYWHPYCREIRSIDFAFRSVSSLKYVVT